MKQEEEYNFTQFEFEYAKSCHGATRIIPVLLDKSLKPIIDEFKVRDWNWKLRGLEVIYLHNLPNKLKVAVNEDIVLEQAALKILKRIDDAIHPNAKPVRHTKSFDLHSGDQPKSESKLSTEIISPESSSPLTEPIGQTVINDWENQLQGRQARVKNIRPDYAIAPGQMVSYQDPHMAMAKKVGCTCLIS